MHTAFSLAESKPGWKADWILLYGAIYVTMDLFDNIGIGKRQ